MPSLCGRSCEMLFSTKDAYRVMLDGIGVKCCPTCVEALRLTREARKQ